MTRPYIRACVALFLLLAGCSGAKVAGEAEMSELYGKVWELQAVMLEGRRDIMHVDARMTMSFAPGGQIAGFSAVNRFAGSYKISPDGKIAWTSLGVVGERKKGAPELIEKELNFLEALRKTNMLIIGRHSVVLQRDDGSTVLSFTESGY
jgi:heat shock protein HslJ